MPPRSQRAIRMSHRVEQIRMLLVSAPRSLDDLAVRTGASKRSVQRWLAALEGFGIRVEEEIAGGVKRFWIGRREGGAQPHLGPGDLISFEFGRILSDEYRGLSLSAGLHDLSERLECYATSSAVEQRNRFRDRVLLVSEGRYDFEAHHDDGEEIIDACLQDESIEARHVAVAQGEKAFVIDPYGILLYKRGFYLIGHSHHHQQLRTFGLDGLSEVRWLRKQKFDRPGDFDLKQLAGRAFGLIVGARTLVRLRFDPRVDRYVRRRNWHPSQQLVDGPLGLEMSLQVDGTKELVTWILGFGSKIEVLAPDSLRVELLAEHQAALAKLR